MLPAEYIAKRGPKRLGFGRVEQNVRANDSHSF
jgi:hypothetical protein